MKTLLMLMIASIALLSSSVYAQKDLTPIKITYAAPTVDNVLIAIAESQGLFEKNGLKAELIGMRGGVGQFLGLVALACDLAAVEDNYRAERRGRRVRAL